MASYTPLPDPEPDDYLIDEDLCVCCLQPATHFYDDRDDMPCCERPACGVRIQQMLDYHDEAGDR